MTRVKNIMPSIAGIGALAIGVTLIKKHNAIKKKENFKSTLTEKSGESSSNSQFVEFPKQRSYIQLAGLEGMSQYMDLSQFEASRNYIMLYEISAKQKTL